MKDSREKMQVNEMRMREMRMTENEMDFSKATRKTRGQWKNIFKVLRKHNFLGKSIRND